MSTCTDFINYITSSAPSSLLTAHHWVGTSSLSPVEVVVVSISSSCEGGVGGRGGEGDLERNKNKHYNFKKL